MAPAGPVGPVGPVLPSEPGLPGCPCGPVGPVEPGLPCGPLMFRAVGVVVEVDFAQVRLPLASTVGYQIELLAGPVGPVLP